MATISLEDCLATIVQITPTRIVISNPKSSQSQFKRVEFESAGSHYQITKKTPTQAFHEHISQLDLYRKLLGFMAGFQQLNAFTAEIEYHVRLTKKGKVQSGEKMLVTKEKVSEKERPSHNREKKYLLPQGVVIKPLVDMGVFTQDGQVVKAMYHKYKQINRFLELIDDALRTREIRSLNVVDFGCGKSYLTFILYYYLTEVAHIPVQMTGLDLKADVVEHSQRTAQRYGYEHLKFEVGNINGYQPTKHVDMVVTLHACDTATDYALWNAVNWGAQMIFSVPCCQHELNAQLQSDELAIFKRYGIVQERVAALMTDAIRANLLQVCGYKTQLLEFIDMAHTPKNIFIRALHSQIPKQQKEKALKEVQNLMHTFSLNPTLYRLLQENMSC